MSAEPNRALPPPAADAKPESRALAPWTEASPESIAAAPEPASTILFRARKFLPHALAASVVLVGGFAMANYATMPALTDSVDEVTAIDAREMGLAVNLDPTGQQKNAARLGKDLGAMKTEMARLQRALDQSKSNQAALTKTAAGQAAAAQDEVKSLKAEIAGLQKTLETTRDAAGAKIDALSAKVEQSKDDANHLAELRSRLDRIEQASAKPQPDKEKLAAAERAPSPKTAPKAQADEPETTGSIGRQPATEDADGKVVRNWQVRDVYSGVALLEGRGGMIEVMRGARAPGIGRVRSIERRDGQWVVVTDKGVILQR